MQPSTPRRFAPLDALVVLAVLGAGAAAIPTLLHPGSAQTIRISRENSVVAEYPVGVAIDTTVDGADGPVRVRIADGRAWIVSSSCRRQVCVRAGSIASPGQQLVCAPNHVVVEVVGDKSEEAPDAITQ